MSAIPGALPSGVRQQPSPEERRQMQDGAIQARIENGTISLNVLRGAPDEVELRCFHPAGWRFIMPLNRQSAAALHESLANALAWLAEQDGAPVDAPVPVCECGIVMSSQVLRDTHTGMGHRVPE